MKRFTFHQLGSFLSAFVLFVLLLSLPVLAQKGRVEVIQVSSPGLKDNLLGDSATRNVTVYLPPEYDEKSGKRYSVVYLLHGYTGNNTLWTGGRYVKGLDVPAIADRLITSGDIQPMILVAPDCHNKYRGSWYTNSPVTGNWEEFVVKDLVRYIDKEYRTITERNGRGIAGHSMGGHGAIKLAMKHPERFSALYAMSPAWVVFEDVINNLSKEYFVEAAKTKTQGGFWDIHWRSQAAIALAAAIAPNPKHKPFYGELPLDVKGNRVDGVWERWLNHDLSTKMLSKDGNNLERYKAIAIDCGSEEDLLPSVTTFVDAMKQAGIEHSFEKFEGGHNNRVASQLEKKVLPLFSNTLQHSKPNLIETVR